ncbi:MAG: RnfABCDGE type electron transport complex subunit G [Candidatus Omnitrophota bacterium]|jgi:electron transport complex protein RnfG|nr:RnfABCDGE type electron transport complex subunit G [Candidatus Omnitrophota bacterium]
MNQLLKFGLVLGVICLAATLVLAVTYEVTKPKIEEQLKAEEQSALKSIMPSADSFVEKTLDGIEYFEALKGRTVAGYCVRVTGNGYNGPIRMIAGVDLDGTIEGVSVLENSETPGLGAKINEIRPGESEPWFLKQFKGKSAGTIAIKSNIDAITGATISSKAVTDAIRKTVDDLLGKLKK